MMTPTFPPPQAYTRDTLTQAYQWLQTQPENIKKLATSADALVRIFLRAKRNGDSSLESLAPVSTEKFRTDLKNIAAELQQFSEKSNLFENSQVPESPVISVGGNLDFEDPEPMGKTHYPNRQNQIVPPTQESENHSNNDYSLIDGFDSRTRTLLKKTQERLNLSSEGEALRLLVVLGSEKLSQM